MDHALTPTRSALYGAAVVMACACGMAANSATLVTLTGVWASTKVIHPIFLGAGAALIVYGLWRIAKPSAYLALASFGVLAVAAVLTPPSVMTTSAFPWDGAQMSGAGLYLLAAGGLGYAFWRAFPSPKPDASATAIGGAALATGCTCCMVTGAAAGMAVTAGASASHFISLPLFFWTGLGLVAVGLFRLGGIRPVIWAAAGGLIVQYLPNLLRLTGDWMVAGVNLRAFPTYLLHLTGAAAILYGFVVAYEIARSRAGEYGHERLGAKPALGGAEGD
jgi:hypothetical protein